MNLVRFQGENQFIYYEFDRDSMPLGEGGMGRIYQGYRVDTSLNIQSIVAIKCIKPELAANPAVIQRAQREAMVQLDSPNLIRMYGFFTGAEYNQFTGSYTQAYYLSMERLLGVNLDEILFKGICTDKSGITVPIAEEILQMYRSNRDMTTVMIMREVLAGIGFLHQNGFIHRDIDPSNIMLTHEGYTKVIDFGICKKIGAFSYGGGLTQAGQFLGKVAYAAPELILGDINAQGPTTDIYALGIMMGQMLMGYFPASGTDQEIMKAHMVGSLDFSGISNKKLRKIVEKATDKDQGKRYQSAQEFLVAINTVKIEGPSATDTDVQSVQETPSENTPKSVSQHPVSQPIISNGGTSATGNISHGSTVFKSREAKPLPEFVLPLSFSIIGLIAGVVLAILI